MSNVAVITARGGNQSMANKNLTPVNGIPIIFYPIKAALAASSIDKVYVCTNCPNIQEAVAKARWSEDLDVGFIHRPEEISTPESPHYEVIEHATRWLLARDFGLDVVTVLLGNCAYVTPEHIDDCVAKITGDTTGCMTVWRAEDDHPLRAMALDERGYVRNYLGKTPGPNRQSYPPAYFYDNQVWAFRWPHGIAKDGPPPWVWVGPHCATVEVPWVTGRDIHTPFDVRVSELIIADRKHDQENLH
jgi:CMP-N-acetylneuraminic acid synthetase